MLITDVIESNNHNVQLVPSAITLIRHRVIVIEPSGMHFSLQHVIALVCHDYNNIVLVLVHVIGLPKLKYFEHFLNCKYFCMYSFLLSILINLYAKNVF